MRSKPFDITHNDAEVILDHLLHASHVYGDPREVVQLKDHLRAFLLASRAAQKCESPPDPNNDNG